MVVAAQPELQSCTALAVWSDVYADLLNDDRDTLATASMTPETFQIRAQCRHKAIQRVLQLSKLPVSRGSRPYPGRAPAGTRTLTGTILSRLPLPIGLPGLATEHGGRLRANS